MVGESSLVFRLNAGCFLRQLGVFLMLDLLLILACTLGLMAYAEDQCAQAARLVSERGVPSAEAVLWMEAGNYTIEPLDRAPAGNALPDLEWMPVPAETAEGLRTWDMAGAYVVELPNGG